MTTKQEWIALAERCEKATGPDDAIDWDILMAMCGPGYEDSWLAAPAVRYTLSTSYGYCAPEWTASLDAITALIERELSDWRVRWHTDGDGVHEAFLENKGDFGAIEARHTESYAATPALALCAAFCRAMAGKAGT